MNPPMATACRTTHLIRLWVQGRLGGYQPRVGLVYVIWRHTVSLMHSITFPQSLASQALVIKTQSEMFRRPENLFGTS